MPQYIVDKIWYSNVEVSTYTASNVEVSTYTVSTSQQAASGSNLQVGQGPFGMFCFFFSHRPNICK